MMTRISLLAVCILISLQIHAQKLSKKNFFFQDDTVTMYDHAQLEDGYHLFIPTHFKKKKNLGLVAFIHGYGALNPMIYGKWIRHLVTNGHVVIYPRYQERLLKPAATEFAKNSTKGIQDAMSFLRKIKVHFDPEVFHLAGHSYGGVIAANLAARYDTLGLPAPLSVFVCEPGTGPFTGGILEDYTNIPTTTLMSIIVGTQDMTVGQKFGEYLYDKTTHLSNRSLIYQAPFDSLGITASHYEPYSLDTLFDIGHRNFTSNKALNVSKFDLVDSRIYWPTFDLMIQASQKKAPGDIQNILWPMIYKLGSSPAERSILDVKY